MVEFRVIGDFRYSNQLWIRDYSLRVFENTSSFYHDLKMLVDTGVIPRDFKIGLF